MIEPTGLLGGESVYCINKNQLADAVRMAEEDPVSAPRIGEVLAHAEAHLTRNERAALAFVLIERLRTSDN
ncbi:MAG: hypothetical protein ISS31_05785 [Kiritimatiellae bacterium]|nr:hypothetical protein [Kiritimatiellia bacterium]